MRILQLHSITISTIERLSDTTSREPHYFVNRGIFVVCLLHVR